MATRKSLLAEIERQEQEAAAMPTPTFKKSQATGTASKNTGTGSTTGATPESLLSEISRREQQSSRRAGLLAAIEKQEQQAAAMPTPTFGTTQTSVYKPQAVLDDHIGREALAGAAENGMKAPDFWSTTGTGLKAMAESVASRFLTAVEYPFESAAAASRERISKQEGKLEELNQLQSQLKAAQESGNREEAYLLARQMAELKEQDAPTALDYLLKAVGAADSDSSLSPAHTIGVQASEDSERYRKQSGQLMHEYTGGIVPEKVGQVLGDAALTTGQMATEMGISALLGMDYLTYMSLTGGASSAQQALDEGYSPGRAGMAGVASGAVSAATESFGGIAGKWGGKAMDKLMGTSLGRKVMGSVPEKAAQWIAKASESRLGRVAESVLSEGAEEFTEYYAQNFFENLILDKDTPYDVKEALYNALIGGLSGGMHTGAVVGTDAILDSAYKASERNAVGASIQQQDGGASLLRAAKESDIPELMEMAEQYADQLQKGKALSRGQLYELQQAERALGVEPVLSSYNRQAERRRAAAEAAFQDTEAQTVQETKAVRQEAERPVPVRSEAEPEARGSDGFASTLGEHGQAAWVEAVRDAESRGASSELFSGAWKQYYSAGKYGKSMEWADRMDTAARQLITGDNIAKQAFQAGQLDAQAAVMEDRAGKAQAAALRAKRESGLFFDSGELKAQVDEDTRAALDSLGRAFGYRFEIGEMEVGNGSFDPSTGVIRLNAKAAGRTALVNVAKHEITHQMQTESPELYRQYKDFVAAALMERDGQTFEELVQQQIDLYAGQTGVSLSREMAEDEVVANATELFLTDEESIRRLCEDNRTLGQKFLDLIRQVIRKVQKALSGAEVRQEATKLLAEDLDTLQQAEALWTRMLGGEKASNEAAASVPKSGKASLEGGKAERYQLYSGFAGELDRWLKNPEEERDVDTGRFFIGTTSSALKSIGVNKCKIYFGKGKIARIMREHPEMTADVIKKVPELLERPILVMQSKTVANRITLLGEVFVGDGRPVMAAVELSPQNRRGEIMNYAVIASAYPRNAVQNFINTSNILYVEPNKNRTDHWLQQIRLQLPSRVTSYGSIASVTYSSRDVNGELTFGGDSGKTAMEQAFDKADSEKKKKRFSLEAPVEETEKLLALHNLSEEKLLKLVELGGIPMPSVAVVRASQGHDGFGDISLVLGRESIDPQADSRSRVYGADGWTPTFPHTEWKVQKKARDAFESRIGELSGKLAGGALQSSRVLAEAGVTDASVYSVREIAEKLAASPAVRAAYLADQGETVKAVKGSRMRQYDGYGNEALQTLIDRGEAQLQTMYQHTMAVSGLTDGDRAAVREAVRGALQKKGGILYTESKIEKKLARLTDDRMESFIENAWDLYRDGGLQQDGVDLAATRALVDERIGGSEREIRKKVESWVRPQLSGLLGEMGIRNEADAYTETGRKSFEETHIPATLEAIVESMASQKERGESGLRLSAQALAGAAAAQYETVDQMRADSGRLSRLSAEDYEARVRPVEQQLQAVLNALCGGDPDAEAEVGSLLAKAAGLYSRGGASAQAVSELFERGGYPLEQQEAEKVLRLIKAAAELPTEYFEAKPRRAVGFDEVLAAVIPDSSGEELRAALEKIGVETLEYKAADEGDRLRKVNSVRGARFQLEAGDDSPVVRKLLRENSRLKAAVESLRQQFSLTRGVQVKASDVEKLAGKVIREYSSKADAGALSEKLKTVYDYLGNDPEPNWETVWGVVSEAARSVLEQSETVDRSLWNETKELRQRLRETKLYVSEEERGDFEADGGFAAFKRQNRTLRLTGERGDLSVDQLYSELCQQYPGWFDGESVSAYDQLCEITDFLEAVRPKPVNPFGESLDEQADQLAGELFDAYFDMPQVKTYADKKQAQIDALRRKSRAELAALKQEQRERYERKLSEVKARYEQKLKDRGEAAKTREERLRYEKWWAAAAEKLAAKEKREQLRDRQQIAATRKKIERKVKSLSQALTKPTDKQNIPEGMRKAVQSLITSLDMTGKRGEDSKVSAAWAQLQQQVAAAVEDQSRAFPLDPELQERVNRLASEKVSLNTMTLEQAGELYKALAALEKAARGVRAELRDGRKLESSEVAYSMIENLSRMKARPERESRVKAGLRNFFDYDLTDPVRFFKRFGAEGIYESLRDGQNQMIARWNEALQFTDKLLENDKAWKWQEETNTFRLESGEQLQLTVSQAMELYLLTRRKQALGHLLGGGITLKDREQGGRIYRGGNYQLTVTDLEAITKSLSGEQKRVADRMGEYLSGTVSEWGNGVTMELYGYRKFTEKHYWPISSDQNYNTSQFDGTQRDVSLANLGMTKQVVDGAQGPLVLGDAFTTFSRHVSQMAAYSAFLPRMERISAVFNWKTSHNGNYRSVKQALERVGGKGAVQYWDSLLRDVNGGGRIERSPGERWMGRIKAGSIAGNPRVVVQQPTAYLRASALISPKYLAKGLVSRGGAEEMKIYAPIARWKDWGYFEAGNGKQLEELVLGRHGVMDRVQDASMAPAGAMDNLTWGRIWAAVKLEVADTTDLTPGSEEFLQAAGRRFSQIIDETQVVDSVLHRTQIMRSKNDLVKMSTAFMSEPLKNLNLCMEAVDRVRQARGLQEKLREAPHLLRVTAAFVSTAVVNALVVSLVDAGRDDDDDETWAQKYAQALLGDYEADMGAMERIRAALGANLVDNLNPLGMIPYLKDALSLFEGYDIKRMDMQGLTDVANSLLKWVPYASGGSRYRASYLIRDTASSLSKAFGLPMANFIREFGSLINLSLTVLDDFGQDTTAFRYWLSRQTLDLANSSNKGLFVSYLLEARMSGNTELATRIYNDLLEAGWTGKQLEDAMTARAKKLLEGYAPQLEAYNAALASGDAAGVDEAAGELLAEGFTAAEIQKAAKALRGSQEEDEPEEGASDPIEEDYWEQYGASKADFDVSFAAEALVNGNRTSWKEAEKALLESGKTQAEIDGAMKSELKKRILDQMGYSKMSDLPEGVYLDMDTEEYRALSREYGYTQFGYTDCVQACLGKTKVSYGKMVADMVGKLSRSGKKFTRDGIEQEVKEQLLTAYKKGKYEKTASSSELAAMKRALLRLGVSGALVEEKYREYEKRKG